MYWYCLDIVLYCIVLYWIGLYCIVSYRIVSYRVVSCRAVSYPITFIPFRSGSIDTISTDLSNRLIFIGVRMMAFGVKNLLCALILFMSLVAIKGFHAAGGAVLSSRLGTTAGTLNNIPSQTRHLDTRRSSLQMNFFEDAFRYFSQLNKEAAAKHILIKVPTISM